MPVMASNGSARVFELIATVVRVICSVIAAVIVVYAIFVLFEANPTNPLVSFAKGWRQDFGWFTVDLFTKPNEKIAEVINAVVAAVIWVVAGSLISKLLVRLAPAGSAKATKG
jgi:uncharacterized membrane protein YraQ (UPF0718 family)